MKKVYVIGIIVLVTWLIVQFPRLMINPGELLSDHQQLNNECLKCHDPFGGISNDKCISCHKPEEIGKDSKDDSLFIPFHTRLGSFSCTDCHTDHQGLHPSLGITGFDHAILSPGDREKCTSCHAAQTDLIHSQLSEKCGNCHGHDSWTDVTFDHNMIQGADKDNCSSCHETPGDSFHSSVAGKCSECHRTDHWVPSTFDHSAYFVFDKHHQTTCATCHTNNDYLSYTCYGCHEHSEANIRAEHQEEGILNFSDCASCHRSGDEDAAEHEKGSEKGSDGNDAKEIQQYLDKNGSHDKDDEDD